MEKIGDKNGVARGMSPFILLERKNIQRQSNFLKKVGCQEMVD